MDRIFNVLCIRHPELLYARVHSQQAPFFVAKFAIQVLPTVVIFRKDTTCRWTGFDAIGGEDANAFTAAQSLYKFGMIPFILDKSDYGLERDFNSEDSE